MMRTERAVFPGAVGESVVSELAIPDAAELARDAMRLHEAERGLAEGFPAAHRRDAFLAGRLALHAALREQGEARAFRMPVLRDARGRPQASWAPAPGFSIAHSKVRAVAAVSCSPACRGLGVDVEEVQPQRAQALLRMAITASERELLASVDPQLVAGPIALWCAREACVKAFAIDVGWFGSALELRAIDECAPVLGHADRAFGIEIRLATDARAGEPSHPMRVHAWQSHGAMFAIAART